MERTERVISAQEAADLCKPILKLLKPFERVSEILTSSIRAEQTLLDNQTIIGQLNAQIDGLRQIQAKIEKEIEEKRESAAENYSELVGQLSIDLATKRGAAEEESAVISARLREMKSLFDEAEAEYTTRLAEFNRQQEEAETKLAGIRAEIENLKSKF